MGRKRSRKQEQETAELDKENINAVDNEPTEEVVDEQPPAKSNFT